MIHVQKLMSLTLAHRQRKAAQTLARIEAAVRLGDRSFIPWLTQCGEALAVDEQQPQPLRQLAAQLVSLCRSVDSGLAEELSPTQDALVRGINRLRRSMEQAAGVSPSDWDFADPVGLQLDASVQRCFPGVHAYLDDIRSPFNVGSIFRTADAFGVDSLYLSPFSADPEHPRASRSSMGALTVMPWQRLPIVDLAAAFPGGNFIALELRGQPIEDFVFPAEGMVFVGSEELGVSPEALQLCTHRISIPMLGAKGSLNVGVAFGVFMNAWRISLYKQGYKAVKRPCRSSFDAL